MNTCMSSWFFSAVAPVGAAPVAASPEKAGEPTPSQIDEKEQQVPNGGGDLAQDAAAESEQDDLDKDSVRSPNFSSPCKTIRLS